MTRAAFRVFVYLHVTHTAPWPMVATRSEATHTLACAPEAHELHPQSATAHERGLTPLRTWAGRAIHARQQLLRLQLHSSSVATCHAKVRAGLGAKKHMPRLELGGTVAGGTRAGGTGACGTVACGAGRVEQGVVDEGLVEQRLVEQGLVVQWRVK